MSLKLAGLLFTGPFAVETTEVRANQVPVVYAVIAKGGSSWAPVFRVVDVGAGPDEGVCFSEHPRRQAWKAEAGESVGVYLSIRPARSSPHRIASASPRSCAGNTIHRSALLIE